MKRVTTGDLGTACEMGHRIRGPVNAFEMEDKSILILCYRCAAMLLAVLHGWRP